MKKLPATLAFQRSMIVTDGEFRNVGKDGSVGDRMLVVEHGIRGTQNVSGAKGLDKEVSNIQRTESAKTSPDSKGFEVSFSIRFGNLHDCITSCSEPGSDGKAASDTMRKIVNDFIAKGFVTNPSTGDSALDKVTQRLARNVLNGSWLWRNVSYASKIMIRVEEEESGVQLFPDVKALSVPTRHFDNPSHEEKTLARYFFNGLSGSDFRGVRVKAIVDFGVSGSVEVYPSQNYCEKVKGFSRSLYKHALTETISLGSGIEAVGYAALRDQKISNALKRIDTWYEDFRSVGAPITVEPLGASLELNGFLRKKDESAFELLKKLDVLVPDSNEGLYMLGILIRGGVFGESSKEDKKAKDPASENDVNVI